MIRVIVADDHPIVREGLRRILERQVGIEVVAEASRGDALPALARERTADVVVLDIGMPGPDFLELIPEILAARTGVRVLVLSGHPEEAYAVHALRAGAAGYLNKADATDSLVAAVRRVQEGGRYISAALAEHLAQQVADEGRAPRHVTLSGRELEVLRFVGAGLSQKEIAARLRVNAKTVSTYRSRILSKLDLRTTADLVRYALEHHLVFGPATPGPQRG
jgi:DNA-binding NarL/FixJ family response regulator